MSIYFGCEEIAGTYSGSGGPITYSSDPGNLGRIDLNNYAPFYFKGSIDEFWYWNSALTGSDVNKICNNTGIHDVPKDQIFTVYPNPSQGYINIQTDLDFERIQIFNAWGSLVRSVNKTNYLNISDLPSGMYFTRFISEDGELIYTEKLILQ